MSQRARRLAAIATIPLLLVAAGPAGDAAGPVPPPDVVAPADGVFPLGACVHVPSAQRAPLCVIVEDPTR